MKKTEKKQFKELTDEELKEVTGGLPGQWLMSSMLLLCNVASLPPCPSNNYDSQCHCIG